MSLKKRDIIILSGITFIGIIVVYKAYKQYKKLKDELDELKKRTDNNTKEMLRSGEINLPGLLGGLNSFGNINHPEIDKFLPDNIKNILAGNPDSQLHKMAEKLNSNVNMLEQIQTHIIKKDNNVAGNNNQDSCSEKSSSGESNNDSSIEINDELVYTENELQCTGDSCPMPSNVTTVP
jgi:hypothetical protein